MSDQLTQLRKRVSTAPTTPGVYRWLSTKGEVLYIGKAKNLKSRLQSYVKKEADKGIGPWKLSLRKHLADFDVTVTSTELEALILETNMIKENKPKYNVMMKDDKSYVYVKISNEEYPQIEVVRQMENDNAKYFGPYLSAYNIKRTLDNLHEIFNFRACEKSCERLNKGKKPERACLEYQIGQCNGLCVGDISQKQYLESLEEVMRFLKGNYAEAKARLKDMMQDCAANKKFEKAAKLRDTLNYIESLGEQQVVSDTSRENTDAIGISLQEGKSQVVVLRERNGKLIEERSIPIAGEKDLVSAVLCEFIPQYYSAETDIPDLILVQEEIIDKEILETWLRDIRGKKTEIRSPERGKKSKLLAMAESNAKQKIAQQFAKWEAAAKNVATALTELKDALNIDGDIKRIEGYDISHLGGTETVGSMVVMKNGKTANKEYRSFTIRTMKEGEIDDYKALKEVLSRRLRYLLDEDKKWQKQGITLGKARKAEQKIIEEISEENKESIGIDDINYKDYVVARKEKEIVGFARLYSRPGNVLQMRSVWVDKTYRGAKIGKAIIRKILSRIKKDKVYLIVDPQENLENYYAEIGFQYVHTPPKVLEDATKKFCEEHPKAKPGIIMVFIPSKNKEDASLKSMPDLLVIDGGKGQLNAVIEVLDELKLKIPVIGLAKREEEVFIPGKSLPIDLPKNSQASFLLQRLRNEAHRAANAHREKRAAKGMTSSALDEVPGIGEKTKKELLQTFGSVESIKAASDDALLHVVTNSQLVALRRGLI